MRNRQKIGKIGIIILKIIGAVGLMGFALVAPNALRALEIFDGKNKKKRNTPYIKSRINSLIENNLLEFKNKNGKKFLKLTKKGKYELQRYKKFYEKPKKWDGKWRLLIFDIKEQYRHSREKLRRELKNFGFIKLQNSVWITPYNVEDFILMLKAELRLGYNTLYMTVEKIENDKKLKKLFNISKSKTFLDHILGEKI